MGDLNPSKLAAEGQAGDLTASHVALCMDNLPEAVSRVSSAYRMSQITAKALTS